MGFLIGTDVYAGKQFIDGRLVSKKAEGESDRRLIRIYTPFETISDLDFDCVVMLGTPELSGGYGLPLEPINSNFSVRP